MEGGSKIKRMPMAALAERQKDLCEKQAEVQRVGVEQCGEPTCPAGSLHNPVTLRDFSHGYVSLTELLWGHWRKGWERS